MRELEHSHHPDAIRSRLQRPLRHSYVRDGVLGGIDGCVTTFAVVASVAGAGLPGVAALGLGLASLVADGFSMAVSNYQGVKSDHDALAQLRSQEHRHIDATPEGEREEIRQIFALKGFTGDTLERIVDTISADRHLWVDTMIREEFGMETDIPSPTRAAAVTFLAFLLVGALPLLAFLLPGLNGREYFAASAALTGVTFFGIGYVKGAIQASGRLRSGVETLAMGGGAALLAYWVGTVFEPMLTG